MAISTQDQDGEWLDEAFELFELHPEIVIISSITALLAASVFLVAITYAISRAGRFQPPVVVLSVVVGLVAVVAVLGAVLRPDVEALTVAAGAAIGSLAGALGTAYSVRSHRNDDVATIVDDEQPSKELPEERGDG